MVKRLDRSQIIFHYRRRSKALTPSGYVRTAASVLQAQPFLVLLWLAIAAFPAWAQTGASLSGVVTNQTGAALPAVMVTIRNIETGRTHTVTTDGGGHFQAPALTAGLFDIRAAKQGFANETRTGVSLAAGQDLRRSILECTQALPTPARAAKSF